MGEKPLRDYVSPQTAQVYRVLVEVRPYNAPLVVRLSIRTAGTGELLAKLGQSGGHPDILPMNRTADVSPTGVNQFLKLLADSGFWSMPTLKPLDIHHVAMGEADWMLEGSAGGKYHLVCRGSTERGSLKDPLVFPVVRLAKVDFRSLPAEPARR